MKDDYPDILALTDKTPTYYDRNGLPRYWKYTPDHVSNDNVKEVALIEIACQCCRKRFQVEFYRYDGKSISEFIQQGNYGNLEYGDPPRHGIDDDGKITCYAGDTMLADELRVIEFWCINKKLKWKRIHKYEVNLIHTNGE